MRGEPLLLERVGGGGLETHRERELEHHHDEERQREHDREEREAALARHGATVRMGITSGRASMDRPPRDTVTVTSTAAGSAPSSLPLQRSRHVVIRAPEIAEAERGHLGVAHDGGDPLEDVAGGERALPHREARLLARQARGGRRRGRGGKGTAGVAVTKPRRSGSPSKTMLPSSAAPAR